MSRGGGLEFPVVSLLLSGLFALCQVESDVSENDRGGNIFLTAGYVTFFPHKKCRKKSRKIFRKFLFSSQLLRYLFLPAN